MAIAVQGKQPAPGRHRSATARVGQGWKGHDAGDPHFAPVEDGIETVIPRVAWVGVGLRIDPVEFFALPDQLRVATRRF
jgi:hypothetical protein